MHVVRGRVSDRGIYADIQVRRGNEGSQKGGQVGMNRCSICGYDIPTGKEIALGPGVAVCYHCESRRRKDASDEKSARLVSFYGRAHDKKRRKTYP